EQRLAPRLWNIHRLAWTAQRGLLLTASADRSLVASVFAIPYPREELIRITTDPAGYRDLTVPADGRSIVAVRHDEMPQIYIQRQGDKHPPLRITSDAGRYAGLSWTPRGDLLTESVLA